MEKKSFILPEFNHEGEIPDGEDAEKLKQQQFEKQFKVICLNNVRDR